MKTEWIYVGGTFDLFHDGHVRLLRQCAELGRVVVALNQDDFAARYKRKPAMHLVERADVVRACRWVDMVVTNIGNEDSRITIQHLLDAKMQVRWIGHGDDWPLYRTDEHGNETGLMKQMGLTEEWLAERNIRFALFPRDTSSTTNILSRIQTQLGEMPCECGASQGCVHWPKSVM